MEGQAKLFLEYESNATTWSALKDELVDEYGKELNSAMIHKQLSERKKKSNETSIEYTTKNQYAEHKQKRENDKGIRRKKLKNDGTSSMQKLWKQISQQR